MCVEGLIGKIRCGLKDVVTIIEKTMLQWFRNLRRMSGRACAGYPERRFPEILK